MSWETGRQEIREAVREEARGPLWEYLKSGLVRGWSKR